MTFVTKYKLGFLSEKYNHSYDIDIQLDGYIGSAIAKKLGAAPILRKDSSDYIMGTSLEMAIQSDQDFELISFYSADNRKHKVILKKNNQIIWSGYLLPEQYQEPYIAPPYDVVVTASDGLGTLKDIDFELTGKHSFLAIIKYCVDKLGLDFGFIIAADLWETRMVRTETGLKQANVDVFVYEGKSCYEVLENILSGIEACITQVNGNWFVGRFTDLKKSYEYYDQNLTKTKTENAVILEMGQVGADCYPIDKLELDIQPAVKELTIKKDYKFYPSYLSNYNFLSESSWSFPNGVKYIDILSSRGILQIWGSKKSDCAVQEIQVDQTTESTYLYVIYNHIYDGLMSYKIKMKITLTSGSEVWYLTSKGWGTSSDYLYMEGDISSKVFSSDDWKTYELKADGFPVTGTLKIELYGDVLNTYTLTGGIRGTVYNEIILRTIPADEGVELTGLLNEKASQKGDDVMLYFGDRPEEPNKDKKFANNITLLGGEFTNAWQIGSGPGDSFIKILMRSLASRYGVPYRILTGIIQGQNLNFGSIIHHAYNNVYYYIKEAEYNLLDDEMSVTLLELPVYNSFPFTMTDTPIRTSSSNSDEHRSVNGKDYRVFTPDGLGVPKRIVDLPIAQIAEIVDSNVLEIDSPGWNGSKRTDFLSLKSYFTDDIDFSSLAKLIGGNNFEGEQNIIGNVNVTGIHTITGDLHVNGNLNQYGDLKKVIAEHVTVNDEFINLRGNAEVAIGPGMLSGFNIAKYDGVNNLLFGAGNDGVGRIGHEGGELQALLTREDSPARGLLWYNETTKKAMGSGILTSDLHLANWDTAYANMGKLLRTDVGSYYQAGIGSHTGGLSSLYIGYNSGDKWLRLRSGYSDDAAKLGGRSAADYWHKDNLNRSDVDLVARKLTLHDSLISNDYSTGTTGYKVGKDLAEFAHLRVRGSFVCTDLIAEKKRAINGGLRICKASGKIKNVTEGISAYGTYYYIELEDPNHGFGGVDHFVCQSYTGGNSNKYYRAYIVGVTTDETRRILIYESRDSLRKIEGDGRPEIGDEIIADTGDYIDIISQSADRQYMTYVGGGVDYMRMGNLAGYTTEALRGLAGKNAAGNLTFLISPGKNVFSGEVNVTGGNVYNKTEVSDSLTSQSSLLQQYADNAVDNVQIGGTNLLLDSNDLLKWSKESGALVSEETNFFKLTVSSMYSFLGIYQDLEVAPNTTYTLSFEAGSNQNAYYSVGSLLYGISNWSGIVDYIPITPNSKNVKTFLTNENEYKIRVYFSLNNISGFSNLRKINVEVGNKATDWAPNPADIAAAANSYTDTTATTTKDLMASKLGYANYNELMNVAISGNTLIKGGYFNTSLLQADAAFVNIIQGAEFNFTKGVAGGWHIGESAFYTDTLRLHRDIGIYCKIDETYPWRLNNDGSGRIASGAISWNADGNVTFAESVKMSWGQITDTSVITSGISNAQTTANNAYDLADTAHDLAALKTDTWVTQITKNTITTEYLNAKAITALGAVTAGTFQLGNGNFAVDAAGNLSAKNAVIEGVVKATSGHLANWLIGGNVLESVNGNVAIDSYNEVIQFKGLSRNLMIKKGNLTDLSSAATTPLTLSGSSRATGAFNLIELGVKEYEVNLGSTMLLTKGKKYTLEVTDLRGVSSFVSGCGCSAHYEITYAIVNSSGVEVARSTKTIDRSVQADITMNFDSTIGNISLDFEAPTTGSYNLKLKLKVTVQVDWDGTGFGVVEFTNFTHYWNSANIKEITSFAEISPNGLQFIESAAKYFKIDTEYTDFVQIKGNMKQTGDFTVVGDVSATSYAGIKMHTGQFTSNTDGNQFVYVPAFSICCCGAFLRPHYTSVPTGNFSCGKFAYVWGGQGNGLNGFWVNRDDGFSGDIVVDYVAFGY